MTGDSDEARYAFYDKNKDARNNGWVWFHRGLTLDGITGFYRDHFQAHLGNGVPDGAGFSCFGDSLIIYRYFPAGKDDRGRDHWVLLLAWLPANIHPMDALRKLDGDVFKHVESDKETMPPQLSDFDYRPDCVKLMYDGYALEVDSHDRGREYIEKVRKCGAVDIVFYREKANGRAVIKTQKKTKDL